MPIGIQRTHLELVSGCIIQAGGGVTGALDIVDQPVVTVDLIAGDLNVINGCDPLQGGTVPGHTVSAQAGGFAWWHPAVPTGYPGKVSSSIPGSNLPGFHTFHRQVHDKRRGVDREFSPVIPSEQITGDAHIILRHIPTQHRPVTWHPVQV
ncbi:hypothetical protein D3C84_814140 [compost metagenome]